MKTRKASFNLLTTTRTTTTSAISLLLLLLLFTHISPCAAEETIIPLNSNEPFYHNFGTDKIKYFEITVNLPSYYESPSIHTPGNISGGGDAFLNILSSSSFSSSSSSSMSVPWNYDYCCYFQQQRASESEWDTLRTVFCENLESIELEKYYSFKPQKLAGWSGAKDTSHRLLFTTTVNSTSTYLRVEMNVGSLLGGAQDYIALVVLVVTYVVLGIELANRVIVAGAAVFVTFVFLAVGNKFPEVNEVLGWLDLTTLLLIFSMNVMVGVISTTGVFGWIGSRLFIYARGNMVRLAIYLWVTTALLSMFLPNVSALMLMAPIAFYICEISEADPTPFVIGETIMTNVGGAATLIGDPPNIIIGKNFDLNFISFIVNVTPCVFILAAATILWLYLYYRKNLAHSDDNYVRIEARRSLERERRSVELEARSSIDAGDTSNDNPSSSSPTTTSPSPSSVSATLTSGDHRRSFELTSPSSTATESCSGSGANDGDEDDGDDDDNSDGSGSGSINSSSSVYGNPEYRIVGGYVNRNELMSGDGINKDINKHHLKGNRSIFKKRRRKVKRAKPDITKERITDVPLLIKSCVVLVCVVVCFFLQGVIGIDPGYTAVVGAITLTALSSRKRIEDKLKYIDLETIILLSTLFILVEGLRKLGLIRLLCKKNNNNIYLFNVCCLLHLPFCLLNKKL